MKWNGRTYKSGYGINIYPKPEDSIKELLLPLSEKKRKGNIWIPVLNQVINVSKETTTPVPVSPSPTPTSTITPTPTPTETPTPTPTPSETPPAVLPSKTFIGTFGITADTTTPTFTVDWQQPGLVAIAIATSTNSGTLIINSITLDGVPMIFAPNTQKDYLVTEVYRGQTQIFFVDMATSSGQLVVNYNFNVRGFAAFVYRLNNLNSTTPEYSNSALANFSASASLTTTSLSSDSVGIGGHITRTAGLPINFTNWTKEGSYTRSSATQSGGSFIQTTAGTRTITATNSNGSNHRQAIFAAVWR